MTTCGCAARSATSSSATVGCCRSWWLLEQARALRPPLRAASYEALFGLLAVTGMRVGEAVALERSDVDLDAGVITIRAQTAKLERARLVPLHPTTVAALERYARTRARLCPRPRSAASFLSAAGTGLDRSAVSKTLRTITVAHQREGGSPGDHAVEGVGRVVAVVRRRDPGERHPERHERDAPPLPRARMGVLGLSRARHNAGSPA